MPSCVLRPAFAQKSNILGLFAVVEQKLQDWTVWVQLACVTHISAVKLNNNLAEYRVNRQFN